MDKETFRFKLGDFECVAAMDGSSAFSVRGFFVNAPPERLETFLRQHHIDGEQIRIPWICLFIHTGRHGVLVDTASRPGTVPGAGRLVQNLRAEGIEPEDIDTVVITHGHPDHIGGNTDNEGKPAFPRARYFMGREEWDFWTTGRAMEQLKVEEDTRKLMGAIARRNLLRIQDSFHLVAGETEVVPGIRVVEAPGHTPGHLALEVVSGGQTVLHISDTILSPLHLEVPEWYPLHDVEPEKAMATKHRLLNRAADEDLLFFASHFPFPGLGRVSREQAGWRWSVVG